MKTQFISEQELAKTYDGATGWTTVTQYRKATRLREEHSEMARAEIARRVDRPASALRGWLAEDKTPRVVKGIRLAQDRGWINVDAESEQFRALNQLVAWIYAGGGIQTDRFTPYFSVDDSVTLAALSHLLRWVQIDYRCRDPDEHSSRLEVIPTDGGSVLGRVLHVLGAPLGVKADTENLTLPSYLSAVDRDTKRDFARIYLLNRGHKLRTADSNGTPVQVTSSSLFADVAELFASVANETVTRGANQQLWISADAVRDLAGDTPLRSALATAAVHSSLTPPTDQAVATTFRQSEQFGGYRYHQFYEKVSNREASRATLASQTGLPKSTIQSWRRGGRPYVTNTLERASERGWLTPPADSETALALTALLAWIFARGSLRKTYYPVFGVETAAQQDRFASIATTLNLSYNTVRPDAPDWPTELRPSDDGTVLGRVLYALGVSRSSEPQQAPLPPLYVYHYPAHARRFVKVWCLHHASADYSGPLTISAPSRTGGQFLTALRTLLSERLCQTVEHTDSKLTVVDCPDEAAM